MPTLDGETSDAGVFKPIDTPVLPLSIKTVFNPIGGEDVFMGNVSKESQECLDLQGAAASGAFNLDRLPGDFNYRPVQSGSDDGLGEDMDNLTLVQTIDQWYDLTREQEDTFLASDTEDEGVDMVLPELTVKEVTDVLNSILLEKSDESTETE